MKTPLKKLEKEKERKIKMEYKVILAREFNLKEHHAENIINLIDEGIVNGICIEDAWIGI